MQKIVTLGQINDDLKFASVTAAQLAEMGFAALDNKPICEALPPEESRRLRNAKLYQADSIAQIRVALAKRLAAPASCLLQIQEPAEYPHLPSSVADVVDFMNGRLDVDFGSPAPAGGTSLYCSDQMRAYVDADRAQRAAPVLAAPAAVAVPDERAAFEVGILKYTPHAILDCHDGQYVIPWVQAAWTGWQARAALAATPAAVQTHAEAAAALGINSALTQAARDVLAERARQISAEGWTPEHDDEHEEGEMCFAAAGYAAAASDTLQAIAKRLDDSLTMNDLVHGSNQYPWPAAWEFKPCTPRRALVKAGALIQAELERIDRAAIAAQAAQQGGAA